MFACPGSTVQFKKDDQNDIDYCEKYRPKEYQPSPYLGKDNPVALNIKKLGLSKLEKCYILMDEPDKVGILEKQLLVRFGIEKKQLSPPILPVP